jgi:hypothetical protein
MMALTGAGSRLSLEQQAGALPEAVSLLLEVARFFQRVDSAQQELNS